MIIKYPNLVKRINSTPRWYGLVLFLSIGLISGFYFRIFYVTHFKASILDSIHPIREQNTDYKYISPLLSYDLPPNTRNAEFTELSQKIKLLMGEDLAEGKINRLGVYFKDLSSGQWTGINEGGLFQPASLLKIPIMIAYFKLAETDKSILNKRLTIVLTRVTSPNRAPSSLYKVGQEYLTSELIRGMIVESDNDATDTLIQNINPGFLSEIFSDLGVRPPSNDEVSQAISPKTFGLFFRVLYNATYLNREFSEKALMLLNQVDFKEGLAIDKLRYVPIAHKFGERVISSDMNNPIIQLHDCGIVYYSKSPYFLCVMTEGKNEDELKHTIQDISNLTLDEVQKNKK